MDLYDLIKLDCTRLKFLVENSRASNQKLLTLTISTTSLMRQITEVKNILYSLLVKLANILPETVLKLMLVRYNDNL